MPLSKEGTTAVTEGKPVSPKATHGVSLDQCKVLCAETGECNSFAYDSVYKDGTCFLKGLILTGNEPTKEVAACTTYYYKCGTGYDYGSYLFYKSYKI